MQYGLIKLISATVLASAAATVACANYSGSNTSATSGGSSSVGGSGTAAPSAGGASTGGASSTAKGGASAATGGSGPATGGAANCPSTTLCGSGDVTGTWKVTSSCLTLSGEVDMTGLGCPTAPISAGQLTVTGTWSANAGLYTDSTNTQGTVYFTLAPDCLSISNSPPTPCSQISQSLPGFTKDSTCTTNASNGCDCTGIVNGQGSMGVPSANPGTYDAYSTDNNLLTLSNNHDQTPYSYCVSGDTLTVIPQPTHPTIAGTITLQKQP